MKTKGGSKKRWEEVKKLFMDYFELPVNGCWEWYGTVNSKGYGQISINGKVKSAHRLSYHFFNGPIKEGFHILHTCDNPKCINPAHLVQGTALDNIKDCIQKGRRGKVGAKLVLSDIQREEIKEYIKKGIYTVKDLSILYKVPVGIIYRAKDDKYKNIVKSNI